MSEFDYSKQTVIVVGAGKSGIAAVDALSGRAKEIILFEGDETKKEEDIRAKLSPSFDGRIVIGSLSDSDMDKCTLLVLSPGVPTDKDFVVKLKEKGVTIWGEAELGYRMSKGRLAAITGTNGKTTTTSLLGEIAKSQFESVFVVGNIGTPCTEVALSTTDDSVQVAEMSSFQLESIDEFHPQVSMILNITPDHLNRHHTMEAYADAKANIMRNQTPDETCILNYEDERVRNMAALSKAKVVFFSSERELENGIFLRGKQIIYRDGGVETYIMDTDEMNIIGKHNHENAMAAIAGAIALGVSLENIRKSVREFVAVEHRIEYTCTKNGVKYYNDSKGTNPDASVQAVKAMPSPTILIGGGYDKKIPFDDYVKAFDGKIKYLLLMGQTAGDIAKCCDKYGFKDYVFVNSMKEAIDFAYAHAEPGENVLLSPACASWGMYDNYEVRGREFKDLARNLPD